MGGRRGGSFCLCMGTVPVLVLVRVLFTNVDSTSTVLYRSDVLVRIRNEHSPGTSTVRYRTVLVLVLGADTSTVVP